MLALELSSSFGSLTSTFREDVHTALAPRCSSKLVLVVGSAESLAYEND